MNERRSSYRRAKVLVQEEFCGWIEETENGYRFQYQSQYAKDRKPPVSLTMPLQEEPYESAVLFPFFKDTRYSVKEFNGFHTKLMKL